MGTQDLVVMDMKIILNVFVPFSENIVKNYITF